MRTPPCVDCALQEPTRRTTEEQRRLAALEARAFAAQTANAVAMNTVANQARLEGRAEATQMTQEAHDNFLRDKAAQVIHKQMAAQQAQQKIDEEFRAPVQQVDPLKVIKEMDLVQLEYCCRACNETVMEWVDRCPSCGEWNTVEVNFREEISLDELGLAPAPVYTSRE